MINKSPLLKSMIIPFSCTPKWTTASFGIKLIYRLFLPLQMYILSSLTDKISDSIYDDAYKNAILALLLSLAIMFMLRQIMPPIISLMERKVENEVRYKYKIKILYKCSALDYKNIENSDTQNLIKRVATDMETTLTRGINNFESVTGIFIQLFSVILILALKVWWLGIFLVILSVPIIVIAYKGGVANYKAIKNTTSKERLCDYYHDILCDRHFADERLIFGYKSFITKKWSKIYEIVRTEKLHTERKWMVNSKLSGLVVILIMFMISGLMIIPLNNGLITTGVYISAILTLGSLMPTITWELAGSIDGFIRFKEFANELEQFWLLDNEYEQENADMLNILKEFESLEFCNVTFCYPGSDKKILDNLSFKVVKGQCVALVGINGSGKSTIVKLILKMYREFEGEILINGISIRDISYSEIQNHFSVLFQNFGKYMLSVYDNIAMGREYELDNIKDIYNTILANSSQKNFLSEEFCDWNKQLGKMDENSVELSGGQWQLIAVLRTLVSKSSFCILDEPTSAIDPIREVELFEQFYEIAKCSTVVLISHRLASVRMADRILVIKNGKIVENGNHEELIGIKEGIYAEMYNKQRRWYE